MLAHEEIGRYRGGPVPQASDRDHLATPGPDHDRCDTSHVYLGRVQDRQRDSRRAPGIHGVAPGLKDRKARRRCQIVARRDRLPPTVQRRPPALLDPMACCHRSLPRSIRLVENIQ
jgi:hypothetical protein